MKAMPLRLDIQVFFACECGEKLGAYIFDSATEICDDDRIHCNVCGRTYLVTRPYIVEVNEVQERAEN